MMKLIQAELVAIVMVLGCLSAWAGPVEDMMKAYEYAEAGNYAEAVKLYRRSANQGFSPAALNLALLFHKGQGVPQDYAEAVKFYRMAATQGDYTEPIVRSIMRQAQFNLGLIYYYGRGVLQDHVSAHMWWNLAGSNGSKNGIKYRDDIATTMAPNQIAEAQRRARDCLNSNYRNCD